jgi:hypothetical protein
VPQQGLRAKQALTKLHSLAVKFKAKQGLLLTP